MERQNAVRVALGLAAASAVVGAYVPRLRRAFHARGATSEEVAAALPGDGLVSEPAVVSTHAVTVDAPPSAVWPWLVQMGPGRGGAYTYDWIENVLGLDMHSVDRIVPEWQHMEVGDSFPLSKDGPPLRVEAIEPERALVLAFPDGTWSWAFVLAPAEGGRTRLISRNRAPARRFRTRLQWELMLPGAYLMERKMLLGIKERAERLAAEQALPTPPVDTPAPYPAQTLVSRPPGPDRAAQAEA